MLLAFVLTMRIEMVYLTELQLLKNQYETKK